MAKKKGKKAVAVSTGQPGARRAEKPVQPPPRRRTFAVSAGLLAAIVFILLCSTTIEGQGLYYDEAHQAPAAFMLLGKARYTFTPLSWGNIPLLTMPYSSAAKSILYGLWMKVSGLPFTVASWRLFGIALVAAGLFGFCILAARSLTPAGLGVFLFFFLTDGAVLLTSRHDWGPTALALSLRLVWVGAWLRGESDEPPGRAALFALGFIPAFSVYEKLNNVVLLAPLGLAVLLAGKGRVLRRAVPVFLGFLAGLVPFILVNLLSGGISFAEYRKSAAAPGGQTASLAGAISFIGNYLTMGDGEGVKSFILGVAPVAWLHRLELFLMIALVAGGGALAARSWRRDRHARLLGVSLLSYLGVMALIAWILPKGTWVHHWMTGTPFQYVALATAVLVLKREIFGEAAGVPKSFPGTFAGRLSAALLLCFALARGYGAAALEKDLVERRASPAWDPAYTAVARFAAAHRDEASFVAADWGFSPQIYALSGGSFPVAEPIWSWGYAWGPGRLRMYLARLPGRPVYVLLRREETPVNPAATEAIVREIAAMTGGRQLPLENELSDLKAVRVIKYAAQS